MKLVRLETGGSGETNESRKNWRILLRLMLLRLQLLSSLAFLRNRGSGSGEPESLKSRRPKSEELLLGATYTMVPNKI
jgi:hypothetical protein